jgi:hypothetical protein
MDQTIEDRRRAFKSVGRSAKDVKAARLARMGKDVSERRAKVAAVTRGLQGSAFTRPFACQASGGGGGETGGHGHGHGAGADAPKAEMFLCGVEDTYSSVEDLVRVLVRDVAWLRGEGPEPGDADDLVMDIVSRWSTISDTREYIPYLVAHVLEAVLALVDFVDPVAPVRTPLSMGLKVAGKLSSMVAFHIATIMRAVCEAEADGAPPGILDEDAFLSWVPVLVSAATDLIRKRPSVPTTRVSLDVFAALSSLANTRPRVASAVVGHPSQPLQTMMQRYSLLPDQDMRDSAAVTLGRFLVALVALPGGCDAAFERELAAHVVVAVKTAGPHQQRRIMAKLLSYVATTQEEAIGRLCDCAFLHTWTADLCAAAATGVEMAVLCMELLGTLMRRCSAVAVFLAEGHHFHHTLESVVIPRFKTIPCAVPSLAWCVCGLLGSAAEVVSSEARKNLLEFIMNVLTESIKCGTTAGREQALVCSAWCCLYLVSDDAPPAVRDMFRRPEMLPLQVLTFILGTPLFDVLENGALTEYALQQLEAVVSAYPPWGAVMADNGWDATCLLRIARCPLQLPSAAAKAHAVHLCRMLFPHHGV